MAVTWTIPSAAGLTHFAQWDGSTFAYVAQTAFVDRRWRVAIFPHGTDNKQTIGAYVRSEAQGKKYVEAWARINHGRIVLAQGRLIMPHEGVKPRKPKGSDDRS
jgi:hypothetical protein